MAEFNTEQFDLIYKREQQEYRQLQKEKAAAKRELKKKQKETASKQPHDPQQALPPAVSAATSGGGGSGGGGSGTGAGEDALTTGAALAPAPSAAATPATEAGSRTSVQAPLGIPASPTAFPAVPRNHASGSSLLPDILTSTSGAPQAPFTTSSLPTKGETRRVFRKRAILREDRDAALAARTTNVRDHCATRAHCRESLSRATKDSRRQPRKEAVPRTAVVTSGVARTRASVLAAMRHTASRLRVTRKAIREDANRWDVLLRVAQAKKVAAKGDHNRAIAAEWTATTLNQYSTNITGISEQARENLKQVLANEVARTGEVLEQARAAVTNGEAAALKAAARRVYVR